MLVSLPLALLLCSTQDIPSGVRYKRADASVNAIAERNLHRIFDKKPSLADYSPVAALPLVIGPGLWTAMKRAVGKEFGKPVTFYVPTKAGLQKFEGRMPKKADELETTWISIAALAERSGKAKIRKASASELSYYWSLISYDIEEPLYVVDCGKTKFIIHFKVARPKDPRPFFVDIAGSVGKE